MSRFDAADMLDRTPVLFDPGRNFTEICRQAVAVGTVETVEFLDDVQIGQILTIEQQVFGAPDLWYPVNRKANRLKDCYE